MGATGLLAACSTSPKTESTIRPLAAVRSSAEVEGRTIISRYNAGQYSSAYEQVTIWTEDDHTISNLFADATVTSHALQLCAWSGDRDRHSRIAKKAPSTSRVIEAHRAVVERGNFDALSEYYKCYLKKSGPSLQGCDSIIRELTRTQQDYKDIWGISRY